MKKKMAKDKKKEDACIARDNEMRTNQETESLSLRENAADETLEQKPEEAEERGTRPAQKASAQVRLRLLYRPPKVMCNREGSNECEAVDEAVKEVRGG